MKRRRDRVVPPSKSVLGAFKSGAATPRPEAQILDELQGICTQPGFVHALAYFCFRDNMLLYSGAVTEQDMHELHNPKRLSRNEINTLIGLMVKAPIEWSLPSPATQQSYVEESERLLEELHEALSAEFSLKDAVAALQAGEEFNPFESGAALREPIFYAAESAYNFQYLDLAARRYACDGQWLQENFGFSIAQCCRVAEAIDRTNDDRFESLRDRLRNIHPSQWTMLPAFCFTPKEVAAHAGMDSVIVERILDAFSLPACPTNSQFNELQDFNAVSATPLLRLPDGEFLSLQNYAFSEAVYESPFFWMLPDKAYQPQRDKHRGEFAEQFIAERLARVFGPENIFTNVDIWHGKTKVGEIDVLVLWADRGIVVQAKSKRLTIGARKGNDQIIRDDFKKGVQDAYDQALLCAECLNDPKYRFVTVNGMDVSLPEISEIFVFCVVSDHYPALSFQSKQFLRTRHVDRVRAALVTDVFLIDAVTELLSTPLHFLSYTSRRARYADRLFAAQELTILGYHLKQNLWFDDEMQLVHIAEDFTVGVDVAMAARRRGLPGATTPDGILTRYEGTTLSRLIHAMELRPEPAVLDQGFQLLEMSSGAFEDLNRLIDQQAKRSAQDGEPHSAAMMFPDRSGLTVLVSGELHDIAAERLSGLCALRKYAQRADHWFGMCLAPGDAKLRFGLKLGEPWVQDDLLDVATANLVKPVEAKSYKGPTRGPGFPSRKVGRNEPCTCGSGRKWKKCCGA